MKRDLRALAQSGCLYVVLLFLLNQNVLAITPLPAPDHIVIVILENHPYSHIKGAGSAPHLNALISDPNTALFTRSYAIEHPSQPNYLDFYAGCNQGVTDDAVPSGIPYTTANLGRQLLDAGKTFITYSENLPSVGYNGASSGAYARKHNPAANWMGTGTNQIPDTTNKPFTAFPADFSTLPTVSYVIPNQDNDMHNGIDPFTITTADTWVNDNLDAYIQWAKTHNSLFILTFDEDNGGENNRIFTLFTGQMVNGAQYGDTINHYSVLRLIEDMYGLPYACNAATARNVPNVWNISTGIHTKTNGSEFFVYPNPSNGNFTVQIENSMTGLVNTVEVYNMIGEKVLEENLSGSATKEIHLNGIHSGMYFIKASIGDKIYSQKLLVR